MTGALTCEVQLDIRLPSKSSTVVTALVLGLLNSGGEKWGPEGGVPFRGILPLPRRGLICAVSRVEGLPPLAAKSISSSWTDSGKAVAHSSHMLGPSQPLQLCVLSQIQPPLYYRTRARDGDLQASGGVWWHRDSFSLSSQLHGSPSPKVVQACPDFPSSQCWVQAQRGE